MLRNISCLGLVCLVSLAVGPPAFAQTRPATSGKLSHNEPEMRRHGSGFKYPNRPRHGTSLRELRYRHPYGAFSGNRYLRR